MSTNDREGTDQAVAKRRKFIAGAAVGAGTAFAMASGPAKAATTGIFNVRDFGPDPNGTWDGAVLAAINSGMPIYFPAGDYILIGGIPATTNRSLVIFGDGAAVSRLIFTNNTNGITFNGTRDDTTINRLVVRNISLVAHGVCATAIDCRWPQNPPMTVFAGMLPHALIEDVAITYNNGSSYFRTGIFHSFGGNSRIVDSWVDQTWGRGAGTAAIHIAGGGSDNQVVSCQFRGQDTGLKIDPLVEGTRIVDCTFLGNSTGIKADGTGTEFGLSWVYVEGCHFDVRAIGIDAISVQQLQVINNYFLAIKYPEAYLAWYGVKMTRGTMSTDPSGPDHYVAEGIIADNLFHRNDNQQTQGPSHPILVSGTSPAYRTKAILIEGNRFGGVAWTSAAVLDPNTTLVTYTDTNLGNNGERVADQGVGNIVSSSGHLEGADVPVSAESGIVSGYAWLDYVKNGREIHYHITVLVQANSGGGGSLLVQMPFRSAVHGTLSGMQINMGVGKTVQGIQASDGPYLDRLRIVYADGTYPGSANNIFQLSGIILA